jgi:5-formyltetrahydrofolate cyclo-ligase
MSSDSSMNAKATVAGNIASAMERHALPDSRFQLDFSQFIPDFPGSDAAARRLTADTAYQRARYLFVTPDNALNSFRRQAIADGKTMLIDRAMTETPPLRELQDRLKVQSHP